MREKRGRVSPRKKQRYGDAIDGQLATDLVTVGQLARYLNGELATSAGARVRINRLTNTNCTVTLTSKQQELIQR